MSLAPVLLQRGRPAVSLSTSVTIISTDVGQIIKRHMEFDVAWTRPIEFLLDLSDAASFGGYINDIVIHQMTP